MGKCQKERYVYFSEACAVLLEEYLKSHPGQGPLFLNSKGKRFTADQIYMMTTNLGKELNLSSNLHPHRLRHTLKVCSFLWVGFVWRLNNITERAYFSLLLCHFIVGNYFQSHRGAISFFSCSLESSFANQVIAVAPSKPRGQSP